MGRRDRGQALGVDAAPNQAHDLARRLRVELAGRLVGEQQLAVVSQRPGDADPLLFAAG
jgi:hypothetical protein